MPGPSLEIRDNLHKCERLTRLERAVAEKMVQIYTGYAEINQASPLKRIFRTPRIETPRIAYDEMATGQAVKAYLASVATAKPPVIGLFVDAVPVKAQSWSKPEDNELRLLSQNDALVYVSPSLAALVPIERLPYLADVTEMLDSLASGIKNGCPSMNEGHPFGLD